MSVQPTVIQKLYLIQVASLPVTPSIPIVCYLVQTQDGRNILIDSGLPAHGLFTPPPGMPAPHPGKTVVEQLAELGIQPGEIDMLICTHLDMDHAGHNGDFTNAQLFIQRSHYEHALNAPRFQPLRPQWDQPVERYHFLEGDQEIIPGLSVIETTGHRIGHQSVLLTLPESGAILLAIDAVPHSALFTPDRDLGPADDRNEPAVQASARKLIEIAEREHAMVIFGHDGGQWDILKKASEFYS